MNIGHLSKYQIELQILLIKCHLHQPYIGSYTQKAAKSQYEKFENKSGYYFVTLAERKSRYYIAILVKNRKSENVTLAIVNVTTIHYSYIRRI